MDGRWLRWVVLLWMWISLTVVFVVTAGLADSGEIPLLRIGTGGPMGVYYPVGQALALGFSSSQKDSGRVAVAQTSGGSVANVQALARKEIEAGLVQADVAFQALEGEGPFSGNRKTCLRAIASLYPERLQVLVRRNAGIRHFKDLKGKPVSLDELGSGTLAVMRVVLEAHGLTETDLKPVYLKPEFILERLTQERMDGISLMAGTPTPAIEKSWVLTLPWFPLNPGSPK